MAFKDKCQVVVLYISVGRQHPTSLSPSSSITISMPCSAPMIRLRFAAICSNSSSPRKRAVTPIGSTLRNRLLTRLLLRFDTRVPCKHFVHLLKAIGARCSKPRAGARCHQGTLSGSGTDHCCARPFNMSSSSPSGSTSSCAGGSTSTSTSSRMPGQAPYSGSRHSN